MANIHTVKYEIPVMAKLYSHDEHDESYDEPVKVESYMLDHLVADWNEPMDSELDRMGYWYNYTTDKYEYIDTPSDFSDYVPQMGGRGLYQLYVKMGDKPIDAALKVLKYAAGVQDNA